MKRNKIAKLWLIFCLVLGLMMIPQNQIKADAADIIATVQGTVANGTTAELLYLSTKDGVMQIKLDSGTDVSGIKVLLPNTSLYVSVTHGNDGYLHAAKIFTDAPVTEVKLDSSNSVTVKGTIGENSKGDLLYFKTNQGVMEIKLDASTKMNAGAVLVVNKTYSITCVRGSDAYLHAASIDDPSGVVTGIAGTSGAAYTPMPASAVAAATTVFTGTVGSNTKENLLYLNTSGGEMQIVIDANTDSRFGMVLTPGRQLTLSAYRGSDAYMHAAVIIASKTAVPAVQVDSSAPFTVTGTVGSKSNENTLYLNTAQGEMELKLDVLNNVTSVTNCKVLVSGKQVTITCGRGSDAYLHVLTIKGV